TDFDGSEVVLDHEAHVTRLLPADRHQVRIRGRHGIAAAVLAVLAHGNGLALVAAVEHVDLQLPALRPVRRVGEVQVAARGPRGPAGGTARTDRATVVAARRTGGVPRVVVFTRRDVALVDQATGIAREVAVAIAGRVVAVDAEAVERTARLDQQVGTDAPLV